jgi:hypothetical protein
MYHRILRRPHILFTKELIELFVKGWPKVSFVQKNKLEASRRLPIADRRAVHRSLDDWLLSVFDQDHVRTIKESSVTERERTGRGVLDGEIVWVLLFGEFEIQVVQQIIDVIRILCQ